MKYQTVNEAAERMGVTTRAVQKWAKDGKLPGAHKVGRDWMIPENSHHPGRNTHENKEGKKALLDAPLPLMKSSFPIGRCLEYLDSIENEDERAIALAEYWYLTGDAERGSALAEPYLDSESHEIRLTAAMICAFANLPRHLVHRTDFAVNILIKELENGFSEEAAIEYQAFNVLVATSIHTKFHIDASRLPRLQRYVQYLPEGLKIYGMYLLAYDAYLKGDYRYALGIADAALVCTKESYPIASVYIQLVAIACLISLMDKDEAKVRMNYVWETAGPDGFYLPFVHHYNMLGGMVEVFFKRDHPEVYKKIVELSKNYNRAWYKKHNLATGNTVAENLTNMEFTVAMLYNRNWRIKEIADHMQLSERTIKNYLQVVYEKLGINGKKGLEQYMMK